MSEHVDKVAHVAEAEVDALPRERMDDVGGIAHERDVRTDEPRHALQARRKTGCGSQRLERAERETGRLPHGLGEIVRRHLQQCPGMRLRR